MSHVCQAVRSNTCDIDCGVCDALVVPTTDLNEGHVNCCICGYVTMQQHQVPEGTFREMSKQGELFKDIRKSHTASLIQGCHTI